VTDIRCYKCGAKSTGDNMEDARSKMNHAIGRSRGIKCGDNYNCIEEIKSKVTIKTDESSYSKVDGKSGETTLDESKSKSSKKKSY